MLLLQWIVLNIFFMDVIIIWVGQIHKSGITWVKGNGYL